MITNDDLHMMKDSNGPNGPNKVAFEEVDIHASPKALTGTLFHEYNTYVSIYTYKIKIYLGT
jgi:hypothetical protein